MKYNQPELLAPAGSFAALTAAVSAGCDAVYLSGQKFGARANAENFTNETLPAALDFAHLKGVKVYYAANTLIKEVEMEDLLQQVRFLYREGIDALIVQDLGVYELIRRNFPKLPLHASTQMTVHNLNGVKFAQKLGFERVVLSRELSLKEIEEIRSEVSIELECFIHGALCYCYSGQCLMSSMIGGRSGNRGTCAQPCRLPYELYSDNKKISQNQDRYLLSPKDIQTLDILPALIQSGIHSFKIEGRMKNPNYVGLMTALYRKYMDMYFENPNNYQVQTEDIKDMHQIYNRGGFSNGYYFLNGGKSTMSITRPNHQGIKVGEVSKIIDSRNLQMRLDTSVLQGDCLEITSQNLDPYTFTSRENILTPLYTFQTDTRGIKVNDPIHKLTDVGLAQRIKTNILDKIVKLPVTMCFTAKIGQEMSLILNYNEIEIKVKGSVVAQAQTSAITAEKISVQLNKTGNDPIEISALTLDLDDAIFISIKELNGLRREGIEQLLKAIIDPTKREDLEVTYKAIKNVNPLVNNQLSVLLRNITQFETVIQYEVERIYLELNNFSKNEIESIVTQCKSKNIGVYLALPRIIRAPYHEVVKKQLKALKHLEIQGVMIRTLDVYDMVKQDYEVVLDYTLNIFNNSALDFWEQKGFERNGISPELHYQELSKLKNSKAEMVVYGYLPLMVTTQCIQKNANSCKSQGLLQLKDRKNMTFTVERDCSMCFNILYNALPIVLLDKYNDLKAIGIRKYRIELLHESPSEIHTIMSYALRMKNKENLSALEFDGTDVLKNYTRGHFARGIK